MDNQNQEEGKLATQNGDPGRTPGSAEGDRETVEADLEQKNLDANSGNQEQDDEEKLAKRTAGRNN